jgi:hypothetical protein
VTSLGHPYEGLYVLLMELIKSRHQAVVDTLAANKAGALFTGRPHPLNNLLVGEFCLLQLRLCCEHIAIAILAIHTDTPQSKRLQSEWNASEIMKMMQKLKPNFFPTPIRYEMLPNNGMQQHPVSDGLTKEELLEMYHFCGGQLHSGAFERYKNFKPKKHQFEEIQNFLSRLSVLLGDHIYKLNGDQTMICVTMSDPLKGGRVSLTQFEKQRS